MHNVYHVIKLGTVYRRDIQCGSATGLTFGTEQAISMPPIDSDNIRINGTSLDHHTMSQTNSEQTRNPNTVHVVDVQDVPYDSTNFGGRRFVRTKRCSVGWSQERNIATPASTPRAFLRGTEFFVTTSHNVCTHTHLQTLHHSPVL